MAAPPEKTISNLTGKWTLDRKLSSGLDEVMALQGLGWLKIKVSPAPHILLHNGEDPAFSHPKNLARPSRLSTSRRRTRSTSTTQA